MAETRFSHTTTIRQTLIVRQILSNGLSTVRDTKLLLIRAPYKQMAPLCKWRGGTVRGTHMVDVCAVQ
jgi:hypothetical protein